MRCNDNIIQTYQSTRMTGGQRTFTNHIFYGFRQAKQAKRISDMTA